jgi:ribosome-associated protein YbcJ (S4-like RNA binding protein)
MEEPPAQYDGIINQIKSKIETMDLNNLVKTLSQVKSLIGKKPRPVQEQMVPILIAGIAVPGVAVAIVAGFIALIIVIKIAKLISRGGRPKPACARRRRLVRKFGLEGNFM